ncbi:Do family serine endopeptidase [Chlorobium sp.]|jgi:serine protease Do|uniref:Do family serine endopeptidase n=1 Tax=Chlorobium sp. TaxID=1095 RepID=UPI003C5E0E3B|nr:Do family serine endopeptidase [Chlorobiaceae bacterium]NTW94001.1 Do family serine endopeptidase [Chlorobiaceae bacterium]
MKKRGNRVKYLLLLLLGIAVGGLVFANIEFSFSGPDTSFRLSSKPNYATAKNNFENSPIETLRDFNEAFVQIAESATPSVVTIFTEKTVNRRVISPFEFFGRTPFDDFFGTPKSGGQNSRREVQRGLGSGVIVTSDGYILTSNHVIDNADAIYIRTFDNRKIVAKVIGADPKTDLAVIKVSDKGLKPILIGDSDRLRVGEWVIAIGSPLGESLARTVTQGIVSAIGRSNVGLADYEDFIQTDAAINPGNSGGPLVNINGELVGINTAIASRTGGFEGIGFAVPSNMAQKVLTSLITKGKVTRGYLGVSIQDIDENIARGMQLKSTQGVLVGTVVSGSPAARAGILTGDVILDFNDRKALSSVELRNAIAGLSPGSMAKIRILRDGEVRLFNVRLEEQPSGDAASLPAQQQQQPASEAFGIRAQELTPQLARQFKLQEGVTGKVVVTAVDQSSSAFSAGLRAGDVIVSFNKQPLTSYAQYAGLLRKVKRGDLVFLLVDRRGSKVYFAFNV